MEYQDRKIRGVLRQLVMSILGATSFFVLMIFRKQAEPFLDRVGAYRTHGHNYEGTLLVVAFMTVLIVGVIIQNLVTSPEQNAKQIQAGANFPPSLTDVHNDFYSVPTWRYILARMRRD